MLSSLLFTLVLSIALSALLTWLWNRRTPTTRWPLPIVARVVRSRQRRTTTPPPSFRPPRDWR
ncbi:MAG: hypothetical protein ACRD0J_16240 [Acidimicrobiales bacterium]